MPNRDNKKTVSAVCNTGPLKIGFTLFFYSFLYLSYIKDTLYQFVLALVLAGF